MWIVTVRWPNQTTDLIPFHSYFFINPDLWVKDQFLKTFNGIQTIYSVQFIFQFRTTPGMCAAHSTAISLALLAPPLASMASPRSTVPLARVRLSATAPGSGVAWPTMALATWRVSRFETMFGQCLKKKKNKKLKSGCILQLVLQKL